MFLKEYTKKFSDWVYQLESSDEEFRLYTSNYWLQLFEGLVRSAIIVGNFYLVLTTILAYFLSYNERMLPLTIVHSCVFVFLTAIYHASKRGKLRITSLTPQLNYLIFFAQLTWVAYYFTNSGQNEMWLQFTITNILLCFLCWFTVARAPSVSWLVHPFIFLIIEVAVFNIIWPKNAQFLSIFSFGAVSVFVASRIFFVRQRSNMIRLDYLVHNAELLRQKEVYEKELELAASIQLSALPRAREFQCGKFYVHVYQKTHQQAGGDWWGFRQSGEDFMVAIGDATGKGMQAALVVHAVQSLWSDEQSHGLLDAEAWLHRANNMLLKLGKETPHNMSMGVLVRKSGKTTYWSAGHVPAYVLNDAGEKAHYSFGGGRYLGMEKELVLKPYEIESISPWGVILATDGLVNHAGRFKRTLPSFSRELAVKGAEVLDPETAGDDQTVIWVRQQSQIQKGQTLPSAS